MNRAYGLWFSFITFPSRCAEERANYSPEHSRNRQCEAWRFFFGAPGIAPT